MTFPLHSWYGPLFVIIVILMVTYGYIIYSLSRKVIGFTLPLIILIEDTSISTYFYLTRNIYFIPERLKFTILVLSFFLRFFFVS